MFYFKRFLLWALIPVLFLGAWQVGNLLSSSVSQAGFVEEEISKTKPTEKTQVPKMKISTTTSKKVESTETVKSRVDYAAPMDQAKKRITKKTFGLYVTPETSPVQPDKFRGFHAGVDWEVFADELDKDVPVKAVCSGNLRMKKMASGYGGVAVQDCKLGGELITVIYGHMKLASISLKVGEPISAGEKIGLLGADKSVETDGRRKHLHLAFHQGEKINIKGYLEKKQDLDEWIDPCLYVCK